jgi:hypothetical protein
MSAESRALSIAYTRSGSESRSASRSKLSITSGATPASCTPV